MIYWINGLTVAASFVMGAWMAPFPLNIILLAGLVWLFTIDLRR
jgi:hypothetical protein